MSHRGLTEATWQRVEITEGPNFRFALGKYGPWRFWQREGGNEWSESEMLAVDELMRRACDIDRGHWMFTRFVDNEHTCHFSADPPRAQAPFYQSQTLAEFLLRIETHFGAFDMGLRNWTAKPETCKWCDVPVRSEGAPEGLLKWQLLKHVEDEHPEELAAIRSARLEELERLRDYYRRRDQWHAEIDDGREPRKFIL
jgi:hypothetical protein